jgi:hypothetical protein
MHARVSFYDVGDPDTAVKGFQGAIDTVTQMDGNQGITLLVDRDNGKAITIVYWNSQERLEATTEQANAIREQAASAAGATVRGVEHYEVAFESGR